MALLTITEGADPNYLATVVKVPTIKPHPNADKLELLEIFGNTIVVGKGAYTEGELVVYFPVESAICPKFLSQMNLFDKPELNSDQLTKGYFQHKGRVRAVALRGIPSQGFLFKVSELAKYFEADPNLFKVGETFDSVGPDKFVSKYVKGTEKQTNEASKKSRVPRWIESTIGFFPRPIRRNAYKFVNAWFNRKSEGIKSQIVDGQFHFHYSTEHLGKNIWLINPEDDITITSKLHGTSAIYANLLTKKTFNPIRSLANMVGFDIPAVEYKFIYSSRSILKNRRDGNLTDDVWGIVASDLDNEIPADISLYGEIVGYTPSGGAIQKNYGYGLQPKECEFRLYRATRVDDKGVHELNWDAIETLAVNVGIKTVPVYYSGLAHDLFPDIPLDKNWHENFLAKMKETYLDKPCEVCNTGVVNEGVVLRIESKDKKPALKFKSPKFLLQETAERDNNESNLEEDS